MTDEPTNIRAALDALGGLAARFAAHAVDAEEEPVDALAEIDEHRRRVRDDTWHLRIPTRFIWAHVADIEEPVAADLVAWAESDTSSNLLLLGPVGVGKTHAAVAAARIRHFDLGQTVHFWPVVDLLDALRPGAPEELADRVRDAEHAPLLILDDLGAERPSDWTAERLYALVNRRWLEERPTIVTTNMPREQLDTFDERLLSRLGHGALGLWLSGQDRRRP